MQVIALSTTSQDSQQPQSCPLQGLQRIRRDLDATGEAADIAWKELPLGRTQQQNGFQVKSCPGGSILRKG